MEAVLTYIRDTLGSTVVLPVVIAILGIILGLKWSKSLRAGIVVGIGFIGLGLVINLLLGSISPVADAMRENWGLNLNTIDTGFGAAAAIALGTAVGAAIIPFVFGLNVIMLLTRMTKTLNVDIWNYWHYAFSGSVVYFVTGRNFWAGVFAAMTHLIYSLLIADLTAPKIQKFFGLPGVSIPQGWATTSVPVIMAMNWVFDKIPGVRGIDINTEALQKRLGFAGEPLTIGGLLGLILGLVSGQGIAGSLQLAMALAATMFLMPRIIAIFMEGLVPLTEQAHVFFRKRLKGREAYVGLDSAVLLGHPATILVGVLLIPITLLLAAVLPGNTTLPFGDLAATSFFVAMCAPLMKGNLFRGLITGTVLMAVVLLLASFFAPALTQFGAEVGYTIPDAAANATYITALSAGNWVAYALWWIGSIGATVGSVIVFVVAIACAGYVGLRRNRTEKLAFAAAADADPGAPSGN